MTGQILAACAASGWAAALAAPVARWERCPYAKALVLTGTASVLGWFLVLLWPEAAGGAAALAAGLFLQRRGSRRHRSPRTAGAKSRARLAAVTARLRAAERRSRPRLRPVPSRGPA